MNNLHKFVHRFYKDPAEFKRVQAWYRPVIAEIRSHLTGMSSENVVKLAQHCFKKLSLFERVAIEIGSTDENLIREKIREQKEEKQTREALRELQFKHAIGGC
jgi:hypothetical protein